MVGVCSVCIPMFVVILTWLNRKETDMKTMISKMIIGGSLALVGFTGVRLQP